MQLLMFKDQDLALLGLDTGNLFFKTGPTHRIILIKNGLTPRKIFT